MRSVKQAKLKSSHRSPKYKYGFVVPRTYKKALEFDRIAGNHLWRNANILEQKKLVEYNIFLDKGKYCKSKIPQEYKEIHVCTVFNVKHNGKHQARVVAYRYLTDVPLESIYSGVILLSGLCTCIFLAELNGMAPWTTDISSAYFEAYPTEKVCIWAGSEFSNLKGHLIILSLKHYMDYIYLVKYLTFNKILAECL